jgi:hypothetical protein
MKKVFKSITIGLIAVATMTIGSCQKYLDQTPDAKVSDNDVFSTYRGFQGFVDQCYTYVTDYNQTAFTTSMNHDDHFASVQDYSTAKKGELGDYRGITGETDLIHNNFSTNTTTTLDGQNFGIYAGGWKGIRAVNLALTKLSLLADATEEQKKLIEGQAYFFRAFFHFEIARCFGGLPYVDRFLVADDELTLPRLNYRETTEKIVEDFDRAANLLPVNWDQTEVGSQFQGANAGRATKGAALAFKARALLYAGSPTMVHESGGGYTYDAALMKRAAEAAAEVIKLADNGAYSLVPFANYQDNFAKIDGTYPWTSETIFARSNNGSGQGRLNNFLGRNMGLSRLGGNTITEAPTQNLVDLFETMKGLPIDDPDAEYNPMLPWENRDPRFRAGIYVDRDFVTVKNANANRFQTYQGGQDNLNTAELRTPYNCHKYQPISVNKIDQGWAKFIFVTPHMRLAEVYMIYAEAVNEISGPGGTEGGISLTAVDAVNKVRTRAGLPNVHAKFTGSKESFRKRIWNELSVEFYAEGHRWFDTRRWHVGHLDDNKKIYSLVFDKNWTFFNRVQIGTRVFEERHYWLPFYKAQVQLYPGFPQNPGW